MLLRKCPQCKRYTLKNNCPICKTKTITAHPPKFSLEKEKKYGKYRKLFKKESI
jgi:H/ACA ribonucleoprotein complex subunit 3